MVRYSVEGWAHLHLASPCALKLDLKEKRKERKPPEQAPALLEEKHSFSF